MNSKSRDIPRFLPTLTEVVDPAELGQFQFASEKQDEARLVELVTSQVRPILELRMQEEFERLVRLTLSEQWSGINKRLRDELDQFVQKAVADALGKSEKSKNG